MPVSARSNAAFRKGLIVRRAVPPPPPPPPQPPAPTVTTRWSQLGYGQNDDVQISGDELCLIDVANPQCKSIAVHDGGILRVDRAGPSTIEMSVEKILIDSFGWLDMGTTADPLPVNQKFRITFRGAYAAPTIDTLNQRNNAAGGTRSLLAMNYARLTSASAFVKTTMTQLRATAQAGHTSITVDDATGWEVGDTIAIAPTDYHYFTGAVMSEERVITGVDRTVPGAHVVSFAVGLEKPHWGVLQYATGAGISLTNDGFTSANSSAAATAMGLSVNAFLALAAILIAGGMPTVVDERADVMNLTKRICWDSVVDTHLTTNKHGAHGMFMGDDVRVQLFDIELRNCGQGGMLGRYPIHWHRNSYTGGVLSGASYVGGGRYLRDLQDNWISRSTIWRSQNRAVTLHGCCGVLVDTVAAYDISGHAFFEEDGSERRNTFIRCGALKVVHPVYSATPANNLRIKEHDKDPSGFWLSNPDNNVSYCWAADATRGFHESYAERCFGETSGAELIPGTGVALKPMFVKTGQFHHLRAYSCRTGIVREHVVINDFGQTREGKYYPKVTNQESGLSFESLSTDHTVFKNSGGNYFNRAGRVGYLRWVNADIMFMGFVGATDVARIEDTLIVGRSLNNLGNAPSSAIFNGMASYHSTLRVSRSMFMHCPRGEPEAGAHNRERGGAISTRDYYLPGGGVEKGGSRNTDLLFVDSDPGGWVESPEYDGGPDWAGVNDRETVTVDAATDTVQKASAIGAASENGKMLLFWTAGTYPGGLEPYKRYYVRNRGGSPAGSSIQLSETRTGPILDITSAGAGQLYLYSAAAQRRFSLADANWDANGYHGPAGNYLVNNTPFYTWGATDVTALRTGDTVKASTPDIYAGVGAFLHELELQRGANATAAEGGSYNAFMQRKLGFEAERLDPADFTTVVGTRRLRDGFGSSLLPWFRHFSVTTKGNGVYRFTHPGFAAPQQFYRLGITNLLHSGASFVIGIPWGASTVQPVLWAGGVYIGGDISNPPLPSAMHIANGWARVIGNAVASIAAVYNDPTGASYYLDLTSQIVYVKAMHGLNHIDPAPTDNTFPGDGALYNGPTLLLRP